jgi:hypothetical protein
LGLCCSNHHELQSAGRSWYREVRDFLNSGRTVAGAYSGPLNETPAAIPVFLNEFLP